MNALDRVLAIAAKEVGVVEGPRSNEVKYNTAYYGRRVHGGNYAWCVVFEWWCMRQAGVGQDVFPKGNNVFQMRDGFKAMGRWTTGMPKRGDLVVFSFSHTGFVTKVHGRRDVETIEGNTDAAGGRTGGRVMRKRRRTGIQGYCRPDYAAVKTGDDMYSDYTSLGVTKPLALPAGIYSAIPWDTRYAGKANLGHPGIVWGGANYDAKVRYRLAGLPDGVVPTARLVEAKKNKAGGWDEVDVAAIATDNHMILTGPDTLSDGAVLWLRINPGPYNGVRLVSAYAKAVYG